MLIHLGRKKLSKIGKTCASVLQNNMVNVMLETTLQLLTVKTISI